jgi:hypothetical protein
LEKRISCKHLARYSEWGVTFACCLAPD